MTNHPHTTSNEAQGCERIVSKPVNEKPMPTVVIPPGQKKAHELLLMKDKCDSHRLLDVLEIPEHLVSTANKALEKMIQEQMVDSTTSIDTQALEQMIILIHQSHMVALEKSLWTIFLKSGTATLLEANESTLKLWPTCLKSMLQVIQVWEPVSAKSESNSMEFDDSVYLKFVTEHLRQLNEQEKLIQEQLAKKRKQLPHSVNRIEEVLQILVAEQIELLRLQYQCKVQLVAFNYQESLLKDKFLQQKPNEQQTQQIERLLHRKYDYETAKHRVLLSRHHVAHNRSPQSLHSVSFTLSASIDLLTDHNLREHLQNRHLHVMQHYENETMKLILEITEAILQESHQLFDIERAALWQDQRSLPIPQRFDHTAMHLIDSRLALIARKVACIYNYKTLQR